MRILHNSDNHGYFPVLKGYYDIVLNTGDFFPNSEGYKYVFSNRTLEIEFQYNWLLTNIENIKRWLNYRPFLFCSGNHDFINANKVEEVLSENNIEAICLNDKLASINGFNFYGFPWIPYYKQWNYELDNNRMVIQIDKMVDVFNKSKIDVLACHCPPYKILDKTIGHENIGNSNLRTALDFKINKEFLPEYICCGHVHENQGLTNYNGILVSNAATTQCIIEI